MPYYLLLVGDPRAIPFSFQYQIDVQYAVGRIHFGTPEEYFRYAEGVVRAEAYRTVSPRQQITFFGVRNPDDPVTERATEGLIRPLAQRLAMNMGGRYPVHTYLGSEAAKDQLHRLLGGNETPALLVTSCHGVRFPIGDPRQRSQQGALLCQDWPGPNAVSGELSHDYYLTADDIASDNARLSGLIAVFFSCYSAGTPTGDSFGHQISGQDERIAPYPFVSRLAQRLLGHPKGGALAVLGYVGRNLNLFEENDQISPFESSLRRLLDGTPVGHAMEYINQRYAELSVDLSELLWEAQYNQINLNARALSRVWRLSNDARSFILLGDPAVRLMAGQPRPGASPDHNPRSTTHPSRTELV
ncbi:MAG: hypothetical protein GY835_22135 [bacterium]|nr:hypothetical protein [bacterium]